jgi:hypothetical protein
MYIINLLNGTYVDISDNRQGMHTTENKLNALKFSRTVSARAYMDFFWKSGTSFEIEIAHVIK